MIEFEPFTLDASRCELPRNGRPIAIQPKVFDFLLYLIEHRDRVVSTDEALENVSLRESAPSAAPRARSH